MGGTKKSRKDDWGTQDAFFKVLNDWMHFDLDAAASESNHKVDKYITKEMDALSIDWDGKAIFLNPPFSMVDKFLAKAYEQHQKGKSVCVVLPNNTDCAWFHKYAILSNSVIFIKGRVQFEDPDHPNKKGNPKGSILFVFIHGQVNNKVYYWDWKKNELGGL